MLPRIIHQGIGLDEDGAILAPRMSVQVRIAEVVQRRVQSGRDSDMWLRGCHFQKSEFPSSHHREEGWRRHQENGAKPPYRRRRGGVPCPSIGTPPRPFLRLRAGARALRGEKRMLRDIFLIARPPLLAVMRGGEFAFLKWRLT